MEVKRLHSVRNLGREFKEFLTKSNMLALAVAVVIGGAVGKVVDGFVKDLIMPLVGVIDTSGDWRGLVLDLGRVKFAYGRLLGVVVDFLIVAAIVFFVMKAFIKSAPPPPPPPTKTCPACKEGIHPEATRCKFCTSEQPAA
jgi:large conductance mechanosensitive channel